MSAVRYEYQCVFHDQPNEEERDQYPEGSFDYAGPYRTYDEARKVLLQEIEAAKKAKRSYDSAWIERRPVAEWKRMM